VRWGPDIQSPIGKLILYLMNRKSRFKRCDVSPINAGGLAPILDRRSSDYCN